MSSSGLPAPAVAVELARVAPNEARYILCWNDSVIVGGSRSAICEALAADDSGGLIAHLTDDLFAVVDEFGGNSRRTVWGVGRHVTSQVVGGGQPTAVVITGENFARLMDDIESGKSLAEHYGEMDDERWEYSFEYTATEAAVFAVRSIACDVSDLFGESFDSLAFNGVDAGFVYDWMRRWGVLDLDVSIPAVAMGSIGEVAWCFQAALIDIGYEVLARRYSTEVAADGVRDLDFYLRVSRPRELIWWASAASFLLADVEHDDACMTRADATTAGMRVVDEFTTLDPMDIVRLFAAAGEGAADVRNLLRWCAARGYGVVDASRLLWSGISAGELVTMLDSGLGEDLVSAVVD